MLFLTLYACTVTDGAPDIAPAAIDRGKSEVASYEARETGPCASPLVFVFDDVFSGVPVAPTTACGETINALRVLVENTSACDTTILTVPFYVDMVGAEPVDSVLSTNLVFDDGTAFGGPEGYARGTGEIEFDGSFTLHARSNVFLNLNIQFGSTCGRTDPESFRAVLVSRNVEAERPDGDLVELLLPAYELEGAEITLVE